MVTTHLSTRDGLAMTLSDGRRLGWAEFGDPGGKAMLYFHGGISCRLDIRFAAGEFADRGIRVIAPDRPGVGLSDRKSDRNLLDWSFDVAELMDKLYLEELPLLGWSLGSAYVFSCAYNLPGRFPRIATVGSCAMFDSPEYVQELGLFIDRLLITCPENFRWLLRAALELSGKAPPHMLKRSIESEMSKSPPDLAVVRMMPASDLADFLYGSLVQGGDGVIDDYWAVREPWGFDPGDIGVDIMLYHGEDDHLAPMSGSVRLSNLIPGARLVAVPDAGHFLLHRKLDMVIDLLFK